MKNFTLTFSFFLFTLFSFAGGCDIISQHSVIEKENVKFARLTSYASVNILDCDLCGSGTWYKQTGTVLVRIYAVNGKFDVTEPGLYRIESSCGGFANTFVSHDELVVDIDKPYEIITKFSVYPNSTEDGIVNLLVPSTPVSLQTSTFKIELYSVMGVRIYKKENRNFGIHHYPINLQNHGRGMYIARITSGEEVKVLKILVK